MKCPCAAWTQLEIKLFGKRDIVCSVFVLHLTSQSCAPLLELLESAFMLEVANPNTVLWERGKR